MDDDLIERLIVRPYERTPRPPCARPDLEDACIGHLWGRCAHRRYGGVDTRIAGLCATCGPRLRSGNTGGSGQDAGILTQSQTMPARIDWDEWAFGIAEAVSRRATCPRAAIGVVLLDGNHHVVATGYNGSSSGTTHCLDDGCMLYGGHCVRAVHAERNAVRAAREMLSKYMYGRGADEDQIESISLVPLDIQPYIYGPREICSDCARVMFRAGITKEPKAKWPA